MSLSVSPKLRAVLIAGSLALLALVLGFFTLSMNQPSSSAAPKKILSLKARGLPSAKPAGGKVATKPGAQAKPAVKPKPVKRPNAHVVAALAAGLPRSVALQLAKSRVAVVVLYSASDPVDRDAQAESAAGAGLADSGYLAVDLDRRHNDAGELTRVLGALPAAPATLVFARPGTLYVSLAGFNDRRTVQQAAANAASAPPGTTQAPVAVPVPVPAPAPAVVAPADPTT